MSELKELKKAFRLELVKFDRQHLATDTLPPAQVAGWVKDFFMPTLPCKAGRRFLNHFRVGADPEFVLEESGALVPAAALSLRTGVFVGADQNGRLAEVRPRPSRSVLEVVASTLLSLRWLYAIKPDTANMKWRSGAYIHGDAIGGHVHFGRKRPTRMVEIEALDAVNEALLELKVYPAEEQRKRCEGDERRQIYGLPGEYRVQRHGFEYRTPPSWLDSPWQAFFCLTVYKLAVLDPELVLTWCGLKDYYKYRTKVRNLLAYYKGMDDDALVAYYAFRRRGVPEFKGGDFKARWGVGLSGGPKVHVLPPFMTPTQEDLVELLEHLTEDRPLSPKFPKPNWSPTQLDKGWVYVLKYTDTTRAIGLGELLHSVLTPGSLKVAVIPSRMNERRLRISSALCDRMSRVNPDWRRKLTALLPGTKIQAWSSSGSTVEVSTELRSQAQLSRTRRALLSGVLPFFLIKDATPENLAKWEQSKPAATSSKYSKVLYGEL